MVCNPGGQSLGMYLRRWPLELQNHDSVISNHGDAGLGSPGRHVETETATFAMILSNSALRAVLLEP